MKKGWAKILLFIFLMISMAAPALANNTPSVDNQKIIVPEKQVTESVVAVGRDVNINGTVQDAIVVINGNVNIENKARILGMVIVVGGTVNRDPAATISGDVVNISLDSATKNSFLIGSFMLLGTWFLKLILSLLLIVFSLLAVFLAKDRIQPFVGTIQQSPRRLLIIGIFTSIFLAAISIALSITIIGIPIVAILFLIILVVFFLVLAACGILVGGRISLGNETSRNITAIKGILLLTAGFNFPLVGALLLLGIAWLSLGIITVWVREKWTNRKVK